MWPVYSLTPLCGLRNGHVDECARRACCAAASVPVLVAFALPFLDAPGMETFRTRVADAVGGRPTPFVHDA
ncbi:hypothetical protein AYO38_09755 [bacterium SCGC AG-212-C10]|nr:hypothetical protein AYO38_09755 [bacterium SCGC AG-212-C10]